MISYLLIAEKKKAIDKYVKENIVGKNNLLLEMKPEGKKYSINEIKQIKNEIKIYYSQNRIFYLPFFDESSNEAQNAILKILEEPPQNVRLVLTATSVSRLLPTVVSRCKIVNLGQKSEIDSDENLDRSLDLFLELGKLNSIDLKYFICKNTVEGVKVCDQILLFFRKRLAHDKNAAAVIKESLNIRGLLERNNITPQMAIDHILIFIFKLYNMKLT